MNVRSENKKFHKPSKRNKKKEILTISLKDLFFSFYTVLVLGENRMVK